MNLARIYIYGAVLALIGGAQMRFANQFDFYDWKTFKWAGEHAGTIGLLFPAGRELGFWYPPGLAFVYAPLSSIPSFWGYAANAVLMCGVVIVSASLIASMFPVSQSVSMVMLFAWCPTMNAIVVGQSSPVCLFLILLSLRGFLSDSIVLTALPIGLLLYKPTMALPFVVMLLLRLRWRELLIVITSGIAWFFVSVAAADDWNWLLRWAHLVSGSYSLDFALNATKSSGVYALLLRAGVPTVIVSATVLLIGVTAIPILRTGDARLAYALACVLVLNLSPHSWSYDAVLLIPTLLLAITRTREPKRTVFIVAAYLIAPSLMFNKTLGINLLALLVVGSLIVLLTRKDKLRESAMDEPRSLTGTSASELRFIK